MALKTTIIVYIDPAKKEVLRRAAEEDDRTLSAYACRVLEAEADRIEKKK